MLRKCCVNVQRFTIVLRNHNSLYKKKRTRRCFPLPLLSSFALLCSLWLLGLLRPSHGPVPSRVAEHCLSSGVRKQGRDIVLLHTRASLALTVAAVGLLLIRSYPPSDDLI